MTAVSQLALKVGVQPACNALNLVRSSFYRKKPRQTRTDPAIVKPRPKPGRSLSAPEREQILLTLNSREYRDQSPYEAFAGLLDQGIYQCSIRTMYRILNDQREVRERRNQLRHPQYQKPELLAQKPNQVWSWDITKLLGPVKWTYFYLYVILDIFSRYVPGWMIASRESGELAKLLLAETCDKQKIAREQLTIHSDGGAPMKAKPVALLLSDLGVTKSLSRPQISNDNPFSEAQFKTLKYRPEFPERFGSIQDARAFCLGFFDWYNYRHHHSGIALLTPDAVHQGQAEKICQTRKITLTRAYLKHPERFVNGQPEPPKLPDKVWINPPQIPEKSVPVYTNFKPGVSQNA